MKVRYIALTAGLLLMTQAASSADFFAYSGKDLYQRFCSSCHGATGAGDGAVAPTLKSEVPDLRLLSRRHAGTFPIEQLTKIIDGRFMFAVHGTRAMPIWGEEFSHEERGNPDAEKGTQLMVKRLVDYVQSIQLKAPATR